MKIRTLYYLKIVQRKLFSKPLFPVISIVGLIIGFVSTVLVTIWASDEFSYDRFNKNADQIYRLTVEVNNKQTGFHWNFARSWYGWLKNIKKDIPGIESVVRLNRWESGIVKVNNTVFKEEIFYTDSSLTDIFNFKFLNGNPKKCLSKPNEVILSKSTANKYFGCKDALGKTILLYCSRCNKKKPYLVTGVFEDTPFDSHVHFNVIASFDNPVEDVDWAYYYILLQKKTHPNDILKNFKHFAGKYINKEELADITPHLQNITDIHLYSNKDRELEKNGSLRQVYMVIGLALFVLFITLFNYFTIRYISLIKESKILNLFRFVGAKTNNIYNYQIVESIVYSVLAAIVSFFVVQLISPDFNQLIGKQELSANPYIIQISELSIIFLVFITVLTGLIPYTILKASQKFRAKKMKLQELSITNSPRFQSRSRTLKLLLGIQYVSTFVLFICVIVINDQLRLFSDYQLGQDKQGILCIHEIPCQVVNKYEIFKEELLRNPLIKGVTSSMEDPGIEIEDMSGFKTTDVDNDTSKKLIYICPVDDNFFSFYGIQLKAGNIFPKFTGNDSIPENYILNEKAVEYLGWKNDEEAIGKPFRLVHDFISKTPGRIVGVVSNFQPSSVKKDIKPYVYFQKTFWLFSVQIKYDTARETKAMALIKNTWGKIYHDFPLKYTFVDDLYKKVYKNEYELRNIGTVLCLLAIVLSSLGLFGITGIVYEARTKEIGIRKVNGARFGQISKWLLKDTLLVVTISLLIAAPLAWYLMQRWLQNYAFKITMSAWIFLLGGIIISLIAVLTVSWQTWRAASRNPVESLRYE